MSTNTGLQRINNSLEIVQLMARDGGASISEMSNQTGLDRWAIRKLLSNLENINRGNNKAFSVELCNEDKRKTIYKIDIDKLWPSKIECLDFSEEETILLAVLFSVLCKNPHLKNPAKSITDKLLSLKSSASAKA